MVCVGYVDNVLRMGWGRLERGGEKYMLKTFCLEGFEVFLVGF